MIQILYVKVHNHQLLKIYHNHMIGLQNVIYYIIYLAAVTSIRKLGNCANGGYSVAAV